MFILNPTEPLKNQRDLTNKPIVKINGILKYTQFQRRQDKRIKWEKNIWIIEKNRKEVNISQIMWTPTLNIII